MDDKAKYPHLARIALIENAQERNAARNAAIEAGLALYAARTSLQSNDALDHVENGAKLLERVAELTSPGA